MKNSLALNSILVPRVHPFRPVQSFWQSWSKHLPWISIACLTGVIVTGKMGELAGLSGLPLLLVAVATPIGITYWSHRKNTDNAMRVPETRYGFEEPSVLSRAPQVSEESFRSIFDQAAGMALVAPDGRWLRVNRSFCETLGYAEDELLSSSFQDVTHSDELGTLLTQIHKMLTGNIAVHQAEHRFTHKLGRTVWALLTISLVRNDEAEPSQLLFQIQDITDRKRAEERLVHDVFHDALTGLPNRALFMDRLKLAVQRARRRKDQLFAVLFVDLDHFKVINDSLGHTVGDQLLIGVARRLESFVRSTDTSARLGGDEFTILLEDVKDQTEAIHIVERIQKGLAQPFSLGGHELVTTASIGVALNTANYDKVEDILRDADTAMYRAKSLGKARHEVFDREMHSQGGNLLQLETDLPGAVEGHELFLQYQPIVSLDTRRLQGFEALVRWQHPKYGLVSPLDFVPIAEEGGLIITIGQWVLNAACRQMREWQVQFPLDQSLFMSVNLSSKQLSQPDTVDQIVKILNVTGLDPRCLKLEITESVVMEDMETAIPRLRQLRALGIGLSIDDFGAGYSSLAYLHRLPVNTLKIDRSFVSRMTINAENQNIVETIMKLARNLGLDVIAEGIETVEQLGLLRELACESGQGYLFSKPVNADVAETLIAKRSLWGEGRGDSEQSLCHEDVELLTGTYSM